ncbi:hypothetical protein IKE79_01510 [Candidatus Saccharibacteria bacterium]|nr:hypothetical protein [Candidatus Saccharibacteria bacterium]
MNKILKRASALCVGTVILVASFLPLARAHAIDNQDSYAAIQMRGATSYAAEGTTYVFSYNGGTVSIANPSSPIAASESWNYGDHIGTMLTLYTKSTAVEFVTTPSQGYTPEAWIDGRQVNLTTEGTYTKNDLVIGEAFQIEFVFREGNNQQGDDNQNGNTEATIKLRGGDGSYTENIYDAAGEIADTKTVYYKDTYDEVSLSINESYFQQMMPEDAVEGEDYSQATYRYNSDDKDTTVNITLNTLWHMRFVDEIVINNHHYPVADYIDYDNQTSYLNHYDMQMVGFTIENVEKADTYDITVKVAKSEHTFIGNFLWTADPDQQYEKDCQPGEDGQDVCEIRYDENGNPVPGRNYIGHSSLALVAVEYTVDGTTYYCNADDGICYWWAVDDEENINSCEITSEDCRIPYLEFDSGNQEYDDGSLVVPAGARVTMRVIPDYGYQVMNVNVSELTTSDNGIGEFTFTVPDGAAYFVADVVETEDFVESSTSLVASGAIDLGEAQTTLTHGSAKLSVSDVELSAANIANFEEAAEGYEIKNYLDISLYNVTCKGATTCTGTDDDSWNERVRDLNEPAIITLQLEDGVDGNNIVIVHEKHDGTYEIIETVYDPTVNTISFATTSFSNYALATRATTPDTGVISAESSSAKLVASRVVFVFTSIAVAIFAIRRRRNA